MILAKNLNVKVNWHVTKGKIIKKVFGLVFGIWIGDLGAVARSWKNKHSLKNLEDSWWHKKSDLMDLWNDGKYTNLFPRENFSANWAI